MLRIFGNTFEADKDYLKKAAKNTFDILGSDFETNLRFVSENRIKELNSIYRKKSKSTNVLSFKLDSTSGGDVVICYKVAKKDAKKWRMSLNESSALLLIHGILHLYGLEHETLKERAKMEALEEKIMATLGVVIKR